MKGLKWVAVAVVFFSIGAVAQTSTTLSLKPILLTNGWKVTGTITTDGTVGAMTAVNISNWNLKVVQTTDLTWTGKDSNDLNISGVNNAGTRIIVKITQAGV